MKTIALTLLLVACGAPMQREPAPPPAPDAEAIDAAPPETATGSYAPPKQIRCVVTTPSGATSRACEGAADWTWSGDDGGVVDCHASPCPDGAQCFVAPPDAGWVYGGTCRSL